MTVVFIKQECPKHRGVWVMELEHCPKCAEEKFAQDTDAIIRAALRAVREGTGDDG